MKKPNFGPASMRARTFDQNLADRFRADHAENELIFLRQRVEQLERREERLMALLKQQAKKLYPDVAIKLEVAKHVNCDCSACLPPTY